MAVTMEQVKELRERTNAGILDCKKVLEQAGGDMKKAVELLRERGLEVANKKAGREAKEGRIETYVHPGNRLAVIVELNCETDFVGRNEHFMQLAKDIAMQIAATNPKYLRKEDVTEEAIKESEAASPEKFYEEFVLLEQPFVRDPAHTIGEKLQDTIAKTGENIIIRRFERYELSA